jgi:hypothetical protein
MTKEAIITCPIFLEQEKAIVKLTEEVNQAKPGASKVAKAAELLKEVEILLGCREYKPESLECQACRGLATLRKQTAGLIITLHSGLKKAAGP